MFIMVREAAISVYLFVFKVIFSFFNLFPIKEKVSFVVSFGDNSEFVYEKMLDEKIDVPVVFICEERAYSRFSEYEQAQALVLNRMGGFIRSIYHLATSKYVLVDNYFGFLGAAKFRKEVKCIQLWHAAGALKKFGLEDQSILKRSAGARKRFVSVYRSFDKVVVGSEDMAAIFQKAFGLSEEQMLRTGVPRTDFFFDENRKKRSMENVRSLLPTNKKVILYAPTFRDDEIEHFQLHLDLTKMQQELSSEYVLLLKLHPAIKSAVQYERDFSGFVYDFSKKPFHINEILLVSDILITDYSSIPYEYAILERPMIFFAYDLEEYTKDRGLWGAYEEMVPGPVSRDTEGVINIIRHHLYDMDRVTAFSEEMNRYSKGDSSKALLKYMFQQKE